MIEVTDRDSVRILRISYGKVNAVDVDLALALDEAFRQLETDGAPAAVLTGTGEIFSAGVHLFNVVEGGEEYLDRFLGALTTMVRSLFELPLPVVAAINGHAIAGGCVLAAACDQRIMARGEGTIGVPELRVGVPFPAMALEVVRFLLPPQHFQQAVYLGDNYLPEEALRRGFVDELAEPAELLARACKVASRLACVPAETFRLTKRTLRQPVLERVDRLSLDFDGQVAAVWKDPATWQVIRDYLARTVGRGE